MDTFVLSIPQSGYKVLDPKRFKDYFYPINPYDTEERIKFLQERKGYRKFVQNPPVSYREQGLIYPYLTIDERLRFDRYSCDLKVSYSNPKIVQGHSLEEIVDDKKDTVASLLPERLKDMGVIVSKEAVYDSIIQTLHYCANILFPSIQEARIFLSRLNKTSLGKWFENNVKTYANDGLAVRFHTDTFEIIFYLKYYDILQKGNRSVDRRKTFQEIQAAKRLEKEGIIPPVVRMEIRFNGTRSIRSHLKAVLGIDKQYWTFQELFDSTKSRKVLLYYWDKIIDDPLNRTILCYSSDGDICKRVQSRFKTEKSKAIDESLGLYFRLKTLGVKALKEDIIERHNRQTWYRKRKMIIDFAKRFTKPDETLAKIVTSVLENKPIQLGLPL